MPGQLSVVSQALEVVLHQVRHAGCLLAGRYCRSGRCARVSHSLAAELLITTQHTCRHGWPHPGRLWAQTCRHKLKSQSFILLPPAQLMPARHSPDTCRHSLEDECRILLLHGVLHLMGLDHEEGPEEAERMGQLEEDIMRELGWKVGTCSLVPN